MSKKLVRRTAFRIYERDAEGKIKETNEIHRGWFNDKDDDVTWNGKRYNRESGRKIVDPKTNEEFLAFAETIFNPLVPKARPKTIDELELEPRGSTEAEMAFAKKGWIAPLVNAVAPKRSWILLALLFVGGLALGTPSGFTFGYFSGLNQSHQTIYFYTTTSSSTVAGGGIVVTTFQVSYTSVNNGGPPVTVTSTAITQTPFTVYQQQVQSTTMTTTLSATSISSVTGSTTTTQTSTTVSSTTGSTTTTSTTSIVSTSTTTTSVSTTCSITSPITVTVVC